MNRFNRAKRPSLRDCSTEINFIEDIRENWCVCVCLLPLILPLRRAAGILESLASFVQYQLDIKNVFSGSGLLAR